MNMLEMRDIRMVLAIAENGSLVRAGRVLGLTQSALTRSLATLEARLQTQLFDRSRLGLEPTTACRAILGAAGEIQLRMRDLNASLATLRGEPVEPVSLAADSQAAETLVPRAVAQFMSFHPHVPLRVEACASADAIRRLRDRRVVLALADISEIDAPEEFEIEPLLRHPVFTWMRPDHPLAALGRPATDEEVFRYPFVAPPQLSARSMRNIGPARERAKEQGGHPIFPAATSTSVRASLGIVAHSDALTGATAEAAEPFLQSGLLTLLSWPAPWRVTNLGILRLRNRSSNAMALQMRLALKAADAAAYASSSRHFPDWLEPSAAAFATIGSRLAPVRNTEAEEALPPELRILEDSHSGE